MLLKYHFTPDHKNMGESLGICGDRVTQISKKAADIMNVLVENAVSTGCGLTANEVVAAMSTIPETAAECFIIGMFASVTIRKIEEEFGTAKPEPRVFNNVEHVDKHQVQVQICLN